MRGYDRVNTRNVHRHHAVPSDIATRAFDAKIGSERLLERQIKAGCVMPEAMARWQHQHGQVPA
jgi:hypothetical protein